MDDKLILDIIVVISFIAAAILLRKAIKNTLRKNVAYKWYHIAIRQVFGFEGERIIVGFTGIAIMISCVCFLFLFHGNKLMGEKYNKKREYVKLRIINKHPTYGGGGSILSDLSKLRKIFKENSDELEYYSSIDFSFNYINQIPSFVWEMKNLEIINFKGNELNKLVDTKFQQLPKLKKIILDENPIDTTNFKQIRIDNPSLNIQFIPIREN